MANLFINYSAFFRPFLSLLIDEGITVDYLITTGLLGRDKSYLEDEKFNDTKILIAKHFNFIEDIEGLVDNRDYVLDVEYEKDLKESEYNFLIWSDRAALVPMTVRERKKLHRRYFEAFLNIFKQKDIKQLFFVYVPHGGWDLIAFYAANALCLKTFIQRDTMLSDHMYLQSDFREDLIIPDHILNITNKEQILGKISDDLLGSIKSDAPVLSFVKKRNRNELNNIWGATFKKIKFACQLFRNRKFYALCDGLNNRSYWRPLTAFPYLVKDARRLRRLKKFYKANSSLLDKQEPYVLFAMHLEPERTTCPEAQLFEDQYMAVRILAKSLPEGWVLYVKENPAQFSEQFWRYGSYHYRCVADYKNILEEPNVKFLSMTENMDKVIENAEFVASIKGTVGWESLSKFLKPSIVFAPAWYSSCPSCYKVTTLAECKQAVENIKNASKEKTELDLLKFLLFAQHRFFKGHFSETFSRTSTSEKEPDFSLMTRGYLEFIENDL